MAAVYIFIFIFGLALGSFVNVLIYRVPEGKSIIAPPSACPSCGKRLSPLDLIPVVSWLLLMGKCRYCKARISPRYLFVELLTGAAVIGLFLKFGTSFAFLAFTYLIVILIAIFFIDADHRIIPDELVIAGLAGGVIVMAYNILFPGQMIYGGGKWWLPLAGILSGSGLLLLVAIIGMLVYRTDDAMGMGDVKLFAPIGMFLGWQLTLEALFLSIILAGIASLLLIILRKKNKKDTIPFGPFIVIGAYLCIILGWDIIKWYTGLL
ncbi:MAG: prepilin peptidase [Ruminiclostridium sp.]|nr:prepilin peptidase [Ruminiclostridium sp.]